MVHALVGVVTLLLPHLANKVVVNICLNEPCSFIPGVASGPCIYFCYDEPFVNCIGLEKKACLVFSGFKFSLL
jgi:hypothetical protein